MSSSRYFQRARQWMVLALAVMLRAIFFYFGKCEIVSNWSQEPNPRLVLKDEDIVDGKPQQNETLFHHIVSLKRIWWEDEHLSLEGRLPPPFRSWA